VKGLTNTYLFKKLSPLKNFSDTVKKLNYDEITINPETLEDNIKIINRRFNFGLKNDVIKDFQEGNIKAIFPPLNNLPQIVPVFLKSDKNTQRGFAAIVNFRLYGTKDRNDNYNIENKVLYALLEDAYINYRMYESWNTFYMNQGIVKFSVPVYVKLMNKVLDKLYGLNFNPLKSDEINYVLGKFFLINVLQKPDNDETNNIAYNNIFNDTTKQMIVNCDADFSNDAYLSLDTFFENLARNFDTLSNLNLRIFLQNWMTMYGSPSVLAIEYYPSLLEMVFSSCIFGARINKDTLIDSVVGKDTLKLHSEISKVLTRK
jgi:hypothetical protein